jgi:hypothetical protein
LEYLYTIAERRKTVVPAGIQYVELRRRNELASPADALATKDNAAMDCWTVSLCAD